MSSQPSGSEVPAHHIKQNVCATRKAYREGRRPKAVKVYTVNNESRYLLIQGVPSVGAKQHLEKLCSKFGDIEESHALDEYPCEDKYTEVYLFKYKRIQSARFAKRKLDDYSFYGGNLHVCYAPEYETVAETREKLQDRRRTVAAKIKQHENAEKDFNSHKGEANRFETNNSKHDSSVPSMRPQLQQHQQHPGGITSSNTPASTSHSRMSGIPPPNIQIFDPTVPPPPQYPASATRPPPQTTLSLHVTQPMTHSAYSNHTFSNSSSSPSSPCDTQEISEANFTLPHPPQAVRFLPHSLHGKKKPPPKYEFSRVPSAHATLPDGYDGRLNPSNTERPTTSSDNLNIGKEISHEDKISSELPSSSGTGVRAVKGKLDTSSIIVKEYKHKGPAPKFVPRQAVKRSVEDSQTAAQPQKRDKLDHEIRQNAFHLGKIQGPENSKEAAQEKSSAPAVPPAVAKSVKDTIKGIRSQISQMINNKVKKSS